ncbi:collagen alpha-1(I) chain-like [Vulpes lagopus]|uniref:collagen alpha-1(I) chain-like n=1 Tax=Vulpes lagopus TaxID=494514 RepID=UPI001BC9CDC0|nr:collagen alpha-1(I) chain-like [Vulpes lagopus]
MPEAPPPARPLGPQPPPEPTGIGHRSLRAAKSPRGLRFPAGKTRDTGHAACHGEGDRWPHTRREGKQGNDGGGQITRSCGPARQRGTRTPNTAAAGGGGGRAGPGGRRLRSICSGPVWERFWASQVPSGWGARVIRAGGSCVLTEQALTPTPPSVEARGPEWGPSVALPSPGSPPSPQARPGRPLRPAEVHLASGSSGTPLSEASGAHVGPRDPRGDGDARGRGRDDSTVAHGVHVRAQPLPFRASVTLPAEQEGCASGSSMVPPSDCG